MSEETRPAAEPRSRPLPLRVARVVRRGAARVLPASWRGRLLLAGVLVVLLALGLGARYYFGELPDRLADDYRDEATPALAQVTDSMDRAFVSFDTYLEASTIPAAEIRSADDLEELKRRILPVIEDTDDALHAARRAVESTRKQIRRRDATIGDAPQGPPLLGDAEAVREAQRVSRRAGAYLRDSLAFLRDYERFIRYGLEAVDLDRRSWQSTSELDPNADLETIRAYFADELAEAERDLDALVELDPPKDAERMHDVAEDAATASVDFLEDMDAAFDNLDLTLYEDARADYTKAIKGLRERAAVVFWRFSVKSGLQRSTRRLSREADALERALARLGGGAEDTSRLHKRPPLAPKPEGSDGGGGQEPDSSVS